MSTPMIVYQYSGESVPPIPVKVHNPFRPYCTTHSSHSVPPIPVKVYQCRVVLRTDKTIQYAQFIEQNKINIESNKESYKRRQAIVEHPYGTLKRQWGFYFIITKKGKKWASAEVGLMFIAYSLRRILNILDADILKKFFQELSFFLLGIFALAKASRFSTPNAIFRMKFSVF